MPELSEREYYHALAGFAKGDYRSLERLWKSAEGSWKRAYADADGRGILLPDPAAARELCARHGIRVILRGDPEFPSSLREIPLPPFALYARGAPLSSVAPHLAIVGTRKGTEPGLAIAERFAEELARRGVTVVSGLAFGIDAAAHRGALQGNGSTVAVLATGLDTVYPREHEALAETILAKGGTLLSEYPPGSPALPRRFLERNRIVSGVSLGTVIIEAPERSGALATARFALEQNREVFVVPGPATHPNYAGSHRLIQEGAALVMTVDDIAETVHIIKPPAGSGKGRNGFSAGSISDGEHDPVVEFLRKEACPLDADAIARGLSFEVSSVQRRLGILVVAGVVREQAGRYYLS